ncbi:guanylate kinase [Persephonella sp.]
MKGQLFILSSPAGGGKTTLSNLLIKEIPNLKRVITCTTRPPRKGEKNGVDYFFLSKEEFEKRIKEGKFLEYAVVHGNYYGTPKDEVEEELQKGYDLILVIDVQGMRQVKKNRPETVAVFLLPPSWDELVKRMEKRGDPPEEISKRLETAKKEIPAWREYDYIVINDILDRAKEDLKHIILSYRLKVERFNPEVLQDKKLRELMEG